MVEITSEEHKVKRMKRTEDSLKDLWDHIKCINNQIIGVPEEEEKKKGYEKIFEEIIVENFPNMEKEIVNQVQEAQRVPCRIKPRRNTPVQIRSDQISRSVMSDSWQPHESQHAKPSVHHKLPEFTHTHVHRVSDAIQPSHPLSSPSPLAPNPSQHQSLFQ